MSAHPAEQHTVSKHSLICCEILLVCDTDFMTKDSLRFFISHTRSKLDQEQRERWEDHEERQRGVGQHRQVWTLRFILCKQQQHFGREEGLSEVSTGTDNNTDG